MRKMRLFGFIVMMMVLVFLIAGCSTTGVNKVTGATTIDTSSFITIKGTRGLLHINDKLATSDGGLFSMGITKGGWYMIPAGQHKLGFGFFDTFGNPKITGSETYTFEPGYYYEIDDSQYSIRITDVTMSSAYQNKIQKVQAQAQKKYPRTNSGSVAANVYGDRITSDRYDIGILLISSSDINATAEMVFGRTYQIFVSYEKGDLYIPESGSPPSDNYIIISPAKKIENSEGTFIWFDIFNTAKLSDLGFFLGTTVFSKFYDEKSGINVITGSLKIHPEQQEAFGRWVNRIPNR